MKIAMISSEYPPKWGGVGNATFFLANTCAKMGHEVHVITREHGMTIPPQHENITVHPVPWLKLPICFTLSFGRNAVNKVISLGNDYDIVHVHSNMALLPKSYYEKINSPVVSTLHGTWWGERSTLNLGNVIAPAVGMINDLSILLISSLFDIYEDYAIELSNAVIVESKSECRDVGARGVKNRYKRVIRLPPGVDVSAFKPENRDDSLRTKYHVNEDEKMLLCVGRLAGRKGVNKVIEAFSRVLKKYDKVKLIIIGEGPQWHKLQSIMRARGLENKCYFVGKLPFDELEAIYATADIFVYHSLWEGYGLIISEALASGTPCVSTNVGGVPEMITFGKDGYYFDVGDTESMAKYILKLLRDEELMAKMSRYARKSMQERFDWRKIVEQTIKLYENVIVDPKNEQNKCKIGKHCFEQ
jgi:glycosyltransferase involved in cell wall biosynthesis